MLDDEMTVDRIDRWFSRRWAKSTPATANARLDAALGRGLMATTGLDQRRSDTADSPTSPDSGSHQIDRQGRHHC